MNFSLKYRKSSINSKPTDLVKSDIDRSPDHSGETLAGAASEHTRDSFSLDQAFSHAEHAAARFRASDTGNAGAATIKCSVERCRLDHLQSVDEVA